MSVTVVLRDAAAAELADARLWYDEHAGLGDAFVARVDEAIKRIAAQPLAHPCVHAEIRRVLVHRFPYAVFYVVEPTRAVVLAIFHASRDPTVWQGRR